MDLRGTRYVSCGAYVDLHPVKMTSPTCEDLGIPTDMGDEISGPDVYPIITRRIIHNPSLHLDGLRYEAEAHKYTDPYSPLCMIPLPGALALHTATEPSFIRKRNERERERVRCVNEGYERLKEHLPSASKEKRISKVETLRGAIDYIRELQRLLDEAPLPRQNDGKDSSADNKPKSTTTTNNKTTTHGNSSTKTATPTMEKGPGENSMRSQAIVIKSERNSSNTPKRRRGSLSSEQSVLSDLSESEDEQFVKRQRIH